MDEEKLSLWRNQPPITKMTRFMIAADGYSIRIDAVDEEFLKLMKKAAVLRGYKVTIIEEE